MDWLRDLGLVAGSRRYPHGVLLYEGIVSEGKVRLEGMVGDPDLQQVQVEHFAGRDLVRIQVVPVRRGRFECPLELFRGVNELVVAAFDASGRAESRRVVHRTRTREWAEVLLVALGVALVLRTFLVQAYVLPSDSMRPALAVGDRILADKVGYYRHSPRRGDVVVFQMPDQGEVFVKRVVGLPGETVEADPVRVRIDGVELAEPYRREARLPEGAVIETRSFVVPPGHYFLMGDDRLASEDSRRFGPVHRDRLLGRAFLRFWPPHRIGKIP